LHQVPYPLQGFDKANLVGIVMNKWGKYLEYLKETYRLWFLKGTEAGSEENLRSVFSTLNMESDDVLQEASFDKTASAYKEETEVARVKGIFGAPSFTVKDENFWGYDRLEDAIRYAKG
jgi:2-hydroxychromene-2-carboxylate isomerase